MTNDTDQRIYRKLLYYFEGRTKVYFKIINPSDGKLYFRIGTILDLSENMKTLVLKEDKLGDIPILFEDIKEDTITAAVEDNL